MGLFFLYNSSMEWREAEQICSKLGLLTGGQLVAIGSVSQLRSELASAYIVTIKLKIDSAYVIFGLY